MKGEFHVTEPKDGISLIIYRPRDSREIKEGVPSAAMAFGNNVSINITETADFLNACLMASQGDFDPLKALCHAPIVSQTP